MAVWVSTAVGTATPSTPTAGTVQLARWTVDADVRVDAYRFEVLVAGGVGAMATVVVYGDTGGLFLDAGADELVVAATAMVVERLMAVTLIPTGDWWVGLAVPPGITPPTFRAAGASPLLPPATATGPGRQFAYTGSPPLEAPATTVASSVPRVAFRVAS